MLKQHLDEVKRSKFVKIERNYTREKWSKDRLKKRKIKKILQNETDQEANHYGGDKWW